jgi:hypothetical protein
VGRKTLKMEGWDGSKKKGKGESRTTVTITIFGESEMWRRQHYLFAVAASTGVII